MRDNAPVLNPKDVVQRKYDRINRMFGEPSEPIAERQPAPPPRGEARPASAPERMPSEGAVSPSASPEAGLAEPTDPVAERARAANSTEEEGRAPVFPWSRLSPAEAAREKRATVSMDQKTEMMVEWILDRTPRMSKNRLLKGWLKKAAEDEVRRLRRKGLD